MSQGAYERRTLSDGRLAFWSLVLANAVFDFKSDFKKRYKYLTSGKE